MMTFNVIENIYSVNSVSFVCLHFINEFIFHTGIVFENCPIDVVYLVSKLSTQSLFLHVQVVFRRVGFRRPPDHIIIIILNFFEMFLKISVSLSFAAAGMSLPISFIIFIHHIVGEIFRTI